MPKTKRKIAFNNECDYCGKFFNTSMPFARFCCDNHRKYFANYKKQFEMAFQKKALTELENMVIELSNAVTKKKSEVKNIGQKTSAAAARMSAMRQAKENIDELVKEFIKENRKLIETKKLKKK